MCGQAEVLTGWWLSGGSANAYQKVGPYPTSKILLRVLGGSKINWPKSAHIWDGTAALLSHCVKAARMGA